MLLLLPLLCLLAAAASLSPSSNLNTVDRARLTGLFRSSLAGDTASAHFSVLGLKLLGEAVPGESDICSQLAATAGETNVELLYHATGTAAALGCPLSPSKEAADALNAATAAGATTASIFFAAQAQTSVGVKLDSEAIKKSLMAALKKDDSLLSLGLAFHTAALLSGDLSKFFDRIEEAVVQADEVNGEMLQFEGGLSVTSVVLTGAAKLAVKAKTLLPVTGDQAVKFANYLMSRKSVQQPKGAFHLLEAVHTMSNNPQHVPVVLALASPVAVSADNPHLVVSLTDLAGNSPGEFVVVLETATRQEDGAVVAAKQELTHLTTTPKYTTDLMAANPPAGFYELVLTAKPVKPDPRFVGNSATLTVKVLTTMAVENAELKIVDTEQGTAGRTTKLEFPKLSSAKLSLDYKEKISVSFTVLDAATGKAMSVHQAFVKLTHQASGSEIIYVAEPTTTNGGKNKQYLFELDLSTAAGDFGGKAGGYSVSVLLGDAVITNPASWHAANLELSLPADSAGKEAGMYEAKPEIRHLFRQPEPRPSAVVSNAFTLLCLSPLLIMLVLWARIGANCSSFPFSAAAVGFHLGLAGIFLLYAFFWLQLNMFQTMKYLTVLGVITFLCGNSLLASISRKTKAA